MAKLTSFQNDDKNALLNKSFDDKFNEVKSSRDGDRRMNDNESTRSR